MRILVACEYSGKVRDAFIAVGHDAMSCDIIVAPVVGFSGYFISTSGRVFSSKAVGKNRPYQIRELKPSPDKKGYLGLTICGERDERKKVRVHRLVAETYLPNPERKPCVRHLDGNPKNNNLENLAWGTYKENEGDKKKHGKWETRKKHSQFFDDEKRKEVFKKHQEGESQVAIAAFFGVTRPTITRLLNGSTWK